MFLKIDIELQFDRDVMQAGIAAKGRNCCVQRRSIEQLHHTSPGSNHEGYSIRTMVMKQVTRVFSMCYSEYAFATTPLSFPASSF
jgi:hypothetical protein